MPTSPKGAKQPSDRKPKAAAAASQYGAQASYGSGWGVQLFDFRTPSGTLTQLKRLDISALIKAGLLDQVDGLSAIVSSMTIPTAGGQPVPRDASEVLQNPDDLMNMVGLIDRIAMMAIVQPPVRRVPTQDDVDMWNAGLDDDAEPFTDPSQLRQSNLIYLDMIPIEDRTAIMGAALGDEVGELDTFRKGSESAVAGSTDVEAASDSTE